jgi:hypothetical protein
MSEILGRQLNRNEYVHHKDHNRDNNDPDNLELISPKDHAAHHLLDKKRPKEIGVSISKSSKGHKKPKGFGEIVSKSLMGKKWSKLRKDNHSISLKKYFKDNPKKCPSGQPWIKLGISRRTWYRNHKNKS